jgi:hypothetical protein
LSSFPWSPTSTQSHPLPKALLSYLKRVPIAEVKGEDKLNFPCRGQKKWVGTVDGKSGVHQMEEFSAAHILICDANIGA